jgi:hypothetical protein
VYKRYLDPLNITLLHLYFQNYIIIEEMERIGNGEDPNSFNRRILMPSGAERQGGPGVAVPPPQLFQFFIYSNSIIIMYI